MYAESCHRRFDVTSASLYILIVNSIFCFFVLGSYGEVNIWYARNYFLVYQLFQMAVHFKEILEIFTLKGGGGISIPFTPHHELIS